MFTKPFFKRIRIRVYDAIFISGKTLKSGVCGSPCFVSKYSKYLLTGSRVLCFQTDSPWAIQVYGNLLLWIVYRWTSRLSGTSAVPLNPGNKTANVSQPFISLLLLKILFHQGLFFQSARSGPDCPRWIKINSAWLSSWPRPRWPWADSFWLVTGYSSRSLFGTRPSENWGDCARSPPPSPEVIG